MLEERKRKVDSALSYHNYGLECDETESWIREKTRVIESTQELGNDLNAVMTIQRKLYGMERDLAAIGDKLTFLRSEADQLAKDHPDNAADILARRAELDAAWDNLKATLKDREVCTCMRACACASLCVCVWVYVCVGKQAENTFLLCTSP